MNRRFILSIGIISFTLLSLNSFPQDHLTFEVKTIDDFHPQYITNIQFINNIHGKTKEFSVIQNNPFNNLPFSIISKNGDQNNIYSFSIEDFEKLIPVSQRSRINKERNQLYKYDTVFNGMSYTYVYRESKKYTIVGYSFYIYNGLINSSYLVAVKGVLCAFDSLGNCIYDNNCLDVNIYKAKITEDGRFISLNYGVEDEYGIIIKKGYRIINISTKEIVLERNFDLLAGPVVVNNLIINAHDILDTTCAGATFEVFDGSRNTLYINMYSFKELKNFKGITTKGFEFLNNNETIVDLFTDKFQILPLNESGN
jgi:hypothetical protein